MRRLLLHTGFWIGFFLMWNQIMYFYMSNPVNRIYFSILDVSLIVCTFYGIYAYLMPRYFLDRSLVKLLSSSFVLLMLLAAGYAWAMKIFLNNVLIPIRFDFSWNYRDLQYNRFFIALLGVLGGGFVKLALDRMNAQRKLDAMEKANAVAELSYLKAQLNPHFLFNSLNSLYTQLDFDLPHAEETLVAIADLLRYQLYECNTDFVPLQKELAYLENYFNLQRIRMDNCLTELSLTGYCSSCQIAPLLLMPFIENAFKYVSDDGDRQNYIHASINVTGNNLSFTCTNTKNQVLPDTGVQTKGIGLKNVSQRLELLYADRYELLIKEDDRRHFVNLTLTLC